MSWTPDGVIGDPFEGERRYQVVYADPPWQYRDRAEAGRRGAGHKYPLLSDADVAALPVDRIAAADAMLFLWVTWPKLPEVLPVIGAWGFRYRTVAFVWVKRTVRSGRLAWGMGSWTRANTEPCLLATRGRPKRVSAAVHQVVEAPLMRHSHKPGVVRERITALAGDVSRIELFARQVAPGWDAWGNDVDPHAPVTAGPPTTFAPTSALPRRGSREWHELREGILSQLHRDGPASRAELVAGTGCHGDFVKALLAAMLKEGVLEKLGRTRGTRYTLADAQPQDAAGAAALMGQFSLRPRGG